VIKRVERLRQVLQAQGLDAILVTRPENQRYLSGFTGGEAALLITAQKALLLTDFRYYEQVAEEAPHFELVKVEGRLKDILKAVLKNLGISSLGFESTHVPYSSYQEWRRAPRSTRWVPTKDTVEELRLTKDDAEIDTICRAIEIADGACDHIRQLLHVGMTEQQISWELEAYMRTHGAEAIAFTLIVGSGPNGAKPHAVVQDRQIAEGEPIVLDIGARVDGYHSDVTRTLCLGDPGPRLTEIYEIVLKAQLTAEQCAAPSMTGQELDAVARRVISDAGYGAQFGHSLGHGVGLAIHEGPAVSGRSPTVLQPGMVFTVEPGIYLPGWGGVRIEDTVLMTDHGIKVLTKTDKALKAR